MGRYDIATGAASAGGAAGAILMTLPSSANSGFVLHRAIPGIRTDSAVAPTNQNMIIGLYELATRGTATTTSTPQAKRTWQDTCPVPGADVAWSVNPTLGNQKGVYVINTAGGFDLPWEWDDGIQIGKSGGSVNGLAIVNIQNAFPAGHRLMMTFTIET